MAQSFQVDLHRLESHVAHYKPLVDFFRLFYESPTPILLQRFLVVLEKATDSAKVQSLWRVRVMFPIALNEPR
jgi:hypothetical protein